MSSAATTEPLAALTETQVKCPYCKRTVETWNDPERGKLMYGHRVSSMPTPATPWCEGGGRSARSS